MSRIEEIEQAIENSKQNHYMLLGRLEEAKFNKENEEKDKQQPQPPEEQPQQPG